MNFCKKCLAGFLAAAIIAIAVTGCTNGGGFLAPKAPDLNKQFTFTAVCDSLSANFTREGIGKWTVELTEPYQVQGVVFTLSGGEISASFGELSTEKIASDFGGSTIGTFVKALENGIADDGEISYDENSYTVSWNDLLLKFPQGSGAPSAFEIPSLGFKGDITDFKITGEIFKEGEDVILVD